MNNPVFGVGNSDAGSSIATRNAASESIYATPVLLNDDVDLRQIGVLTTSQSLGGTAIVAIYTDKIVDGAHYPDQRLANTSSYTLGTSSLNLRSPAPFIKLNKDTMYWAVAWIYENSAAGDAVQLYRYNSKTIGGWATRYALSDNPWGGAIPSVFPSSPLMNTGELGIFLVVQKYWQ